MSTTTNRGTHRAVASKRQVSPALLPALQPWLGGGKIVTGAFAEDLIVQFQSVGINHAGATRLLEVARIALDEVLADIDSHALAAAPVAEQVSMLLPRFDVEKVARVCRLRKAEVQSALALLVLAFVAQASHAHH